jgi:hypothetical protein
MRIHRLDELPPGPYHDEAYNGLDARALLRKKNFPIFHDTWEIYADKIHAKQPSYSTHFPVYLEGNYGREPLYVYLMATGFWLFGISDWALRLPSAIGGVLAICMVAPMTSIVPKTVENHCHLTLIGMTVALSLYPLLVFSRLGLRAIWFIVLQGSTIIVFWHAWQSNHFITWAISGALLGLSQYTYGAARLLPLVLATFISIRSFIQRYPSRKRQKGLIGMTLMFLIIIAPLVYFFMRYPEFLTLRTNVIAANTNGSGWRLWLYNSLQAIHGLFWKGDPNPLLNLPYRPFLDPIQAGFALVGFIVVLREIHRPSNTLLLLWLAAMLTPSILVGKAPHFGRSLGIVSPLIIIIVIGVKQVWHSVLPSHTIATLGIAGCLVFSFISTTYDYFIRYPRTPDLYYEFKAHLAELGRFARSLTKDTTLYLTPPQKYYAGILFELRDQHRIQDFYGPAGLLPAGISDLPSVYLIMAEDTFTASKVEQIFPYGEWITKTLDFGAYYVPSNSVLNPDISLQATFGDFIELQGVDLSGSLTKETLSVQFYWKAVAPPPTSYTAFLHLISPDGNLVAQQDRPPGHNTYTTDRWRTGEIVLDTYTLSLPPDLESEPGIYHLLTGFYDASIVRLPVTQRGQVQNDRTVLLSTLEIP